MTLGIEDKCSHQNVVYATERGLYVGTRVCVMRRRRFPVGRAKMQSTGVF